MSVFDDSDDVKVEVINREKRKYILIDDLIKWMKTTCSNLSEKEFEDDPNVELVHKFIKELIKLKNSK